MASNRPRVRVPRKAAKGEVIGIKTLISHEMETGQRRDDEGNKIPRQIIHTFKCNYNGKTVFEADMYPGVSANPYFEFFVKAEESGELEFVWTEDGGQTFSTKEKIEVS
jgi:sulfur-oxidizing protein SoxZ